MSAVYTKLRSGEWGLKITDDETCEGEVVAVRKKDGSINHETVGRIIFECDAYSICTIVEPGQSGNYSELKARDGYYDSKPIPYSYHEQQYCPDSMGDPSRPDYKDDEYVEDEAELKTRRSYY